MTAGSHSGLKGGIGRIIARVKKLKGDPHHIALGVAIGVFIGATPTIPFHMVLAVALALALRASKPGAVIGVWFSNPLTIPFLYMGSYKTGRFLLGASIPYDMKYDSILELTKMGMEVTLAMLIGGIVIGIVPAVVAYVAVKGIIARVHLRKTQGQMHIPKGDRPVGQETKPFPDPIGETGRSFSPGVVSKRPDSFSRQNEIL